MENSIKDRLHEFIQKIDSNPWRFSLSIGKTGSYARTISGGISSDVIGEILRVYPELNVNWLISGKGEMFVPKDSEQDLFLKFRMSELTEENKSLREKNEELIRQVGYLQGQVDLLTGNHSQATGA